MPEDVVIDEDTFKFGLQAEGTGQPEHLASAASMVAVQQRHRWVLSPDIWAAYRRHASRRDYYRGAIASELQRSLNAVVHDEARHVWLQDPPHIEGSYHRKDAHVVAAAAAVPASKLVTSDKRLSSGLHRDGIPEVHNFRVIDPFEAETVLAGD